jgi:hypothetical protein
MSSAATARRSAIGMTSISVGSSSGDGGYRGMPDACARRACRTVQRLRAGSLRLQFVLQPALPEVSRPGAGRMARGAAGRVAASTVLPCRLHLANAGGGDRLKRVAYALLFRAAAEAMGDVAADARHLGAEIGAAAVLHSWGQAMTSIVPAGGLSPDHARWWHAVRDSSCRCVFSPGASVRSSWRGCARRSLPAACSSPVPRHAR